MTLPGQMELATVVDHKPSLTKEFVNDAIAFDEFLNPPLSDHKPRPIRAKELGVTYDAFCSAQGVRLAKMLSQYDESPSSQLWSDIQRLAREILK